MKKLSLLVLISFITPSLYAEDKQAMNPKKMEMMEKFKEYSTVGEQHKILHSFVGKWTYTSKFWEKSDAKPEESKGTSTMEMIMGGRFLQHKSAGKSMGMNWEGMGLTGYDNLKKQYNTLWIDNMGTGMMHGIGEFDVTTQTLKDKGEFTCPMTQNNKGEYRGEWKIVDKNNLMYSMFGKGMEDKEFKMMELNFKRKK